MNELRRNRFKQDLMSGNTLFGLWHSIPDTSVAEMMAGSGFDWILVDQEHGPLELRDVMHALQAMAPYDVAPVVRTVDDNPALLKRMCDIGVRSFLVPMIDTPEQAAAVVESVRYAPAGKRGMGTSMARAARWNATPNYVRDANDQMCVIVQAESTTAIEHLEAIASVDGVDAVFIGPSDLSASMGHAGNVSQPEVVQTVSDALKTIRKANKSAGLLCLDESGIAHYVECGANFVGIAVDTLLIGNAARQLVARVKSSGSDDTPAPAGY